MKYTYGSIEMDNRKNRNDKLNCSEVLIYINIDGLD